MESESGDVCDRRRSVPGAGEPDRSRSINIVRKNTEMQITKLQVATRQLGVAIDLFLSGDYLCSLTLAGAAEEILGKLSGRAGKPVAVDEIVQFHDDDIDAAIPEGQRRSSLLSVLNRGRNQAKHANNPSETEFLIEKIWPLQMIMRALPMALNFDDTMSESKDRMDVWIRSHPEAFE
jgi:hypothetical protein